MRCWLRAVRLNVSTDSGEFGRTIRLASGLNVVRGDNSRGKTQVVQAIIYALGMERMLTARATAPLGSAFTTELAVQADGEEYVLPTRSSWVAVELANSSGEVLTVHRHVRHPQFATDLVRVWEGPAITDSEAAGDWSDYYLHRAGSATRELGFHTRLASFLGWQLPQVPTFSGSVALLYADVVFPFLVVDQQSWGSTAPRKVDRYQIREPLRRAAQFLLGLTGPEAEAERSRLEAQVAQLRTDWAVHRSALSALGSTVGGRVVGVPETPAGSRARQGSGSVPPTSLEEVRLEILQGDEWLDSGVVMDRLEAEMAALDAPRPVLADRRHSQAAEELDQARDELAEVLAASRLLDSELSLGEAQVAALDRRVRALEEERARNVDVRTLARLGSEVAARHLAEHNCPTCKQSLDGVEADDVAPTLDVDETIQLLNAQTATSRRMRDRALQGLDQSATAYSALQRRADELRARVRALEADLIGPAELSRGDIARRVTTELRRDELDRALSVFATRLDALADIATRVARLREQIQGLPEGVPEDDTHVLRQVERLMRDHMKVSGFGSYDVAEIKLDEDALRPTRDGFDVDTDVSASDVVRTKIAYLTAMRSVGLDRGNHPGILVLDEPRQQDIQSADFGTILRYLATDAAGEAEQVLVTSATAVEELRTLLGDQAGSVTFIDFGSDRVLQRLDDDVPGES